MDGGQRVCRATNVEMEHLATRAGRLGAMKISKDMAEHVSPWPHREQRDQVTRAQASSRACAGAVLVSGGGGGPSQIGALPLYHLFHGST